MLSKRAVFAENYMQQYKHLLLKQSMKNCRIVDKREAGYEERILRDIQNGITLEKLNMKNEKKTAESKKAVYEETCSRK